MADLGQRLIRKVGDDPATVDAYNGSREQNRVPCGSSTALLRPEADAAFITDRVRDHRARNHAPSTPGRKFEPRRTEGGGLPPTPSGSRRSPSSSASNIVYEAARVFINGEFTMGENIGDMSGLQVAHEAYLMSLKGKRAPVIDGLTGDQRFFLAFAQAWRGNQRDDAIKTQVASDPHSPRRFRVIGPVRNLDAWYQAFGRYGFENKSLRRRGSGVVRQAVAEGEVDVRVG